MATDYNHVADGSDTATNDDTGLLADQWRRIIERQGDGGDGRVAYGDLIEALAQSDMIGVDAAGASGMIEGAIADGVLEEDTGEAWSMLSIDEDAQANAGDVSATTASDGADDTERADSPSYAAMFADAQTRAGTEWWEIVPEPSVRAALADHGMGVLVDHGLADVDRWRWADLSDIEGTEYDAGWYYASDDEPRPDEFRRFHELLMAHAPDGYEPHYFRVERASKDPATRFGLWKTDTARLTVDEAVTWMQQGGNVGIAGTPADELVNLDIDDDEETTPDDHPTTLRARSRSRSGYHGWYFNPAGDVPNIPTDTAGEIRTEWQYVVAPGSFVASAAAEIPAEFHDGSPGYYTVEEEAPVARIEYDDLPPVFQEFYEEAQTQDDADAADGAAEDTGAAYPSDYSGATADAQSAVFDVSAEDVLRKEGVSTDTSDRFSSAFHGSGTGANMSLSDKGRVQCWRHNVAHGGLQALAVLSDHSPSDDTACLQIGKAHKNSGAGPNRYKGDWELTWWAWAYAKRRGYIPDDDPVPQSVLIGLAIKHGHCEHDDLVERETTAGDGDSDNDSDTFDALPFDAYNATLATIEEEYSLDPGREPLGGDNDGGSGRGSGRALGPQQHIEACERPPATTDADPIDVDARRDDMTGGGYERFIVHHGLTIRGDPPGVGKTTSVAIGAADRDRPHVVLLPKHENCREFQTDPAKPGGYFHLKGAGQPQGDVCMDARVSDDAEDCDRHGHPSNCPPMCPIYQFDPEHPLRIRFDRLAATRGVQAAHSKLSLHAERWHGETCMWQDQWDDLDAADRVVTVRNYATLKSVREHGDIILDDANDGFAEEVLYGFEALVKTQRACQRFGDLAGDDEIAETFAILAGFIDDLLDALTDGDVSLAGVADLTSESESAFPLRPRTYDDPAAVPDYIPESRISETRTREYVGEGDYYVHKDGVEVHERDLAERLAQAKLFYEETVVDQIRRDEWDGIPFALDTVFGVLAAVTDDATVAHDARVAAGFDAALDECPRCYSTLVARQGARLCPECHWHEDHSRLIDDHGRDRPARIDVDVATDAGGAVLGLITRRLPAIERLPAPEDVLVLDATPRTAIYAAVFVVAPETIHTEGDDAYSLPHATVTQIVDGAYHRSTLEQSVTARDRMQRAIERINARHDEVVFVALKSARHLLTWPDDAEVMSYYALRGLDRPNADAVVCVGAPHPDPDDLRAEARALTAETELQAGGREHSTRQDEGVGDPVYRPLKYVADDGTGREVASKTYTGLTGELFDGRHADEIEQAAHRNRPILADGANGEDDHRHVYLLTNVATDLPIDRLTTFDAFLSPGEYRVAVRDSALDLLDVMADVAQRDENDSEYATDGGPASIGATVAEWHDAAERADMDVTQRTIRNALGDLRDAGLVAKDDAYTQHRGYLQTITDLGARVVGR